MMTRPSVLLIGGSGIIGRYIERAANDQGYDVTSVSRRGARPGARFRTEHIAADFRRVDALADLTGNRTFDATIDLLSFGPEQAERTMRLVAGVGGQYIFVSSATIYEASSGDSPIQEEHPRVVAGWSYPLAKIAAEDAVRRGAAEENIDFTIVRPYITYSEQRLPFGPWEAEQVMHRLASERPVAVGSSVESRLTALTHSEDVGRAIVALIGNESAINEDFHIATPQSVTWGDLYRIVADGLGVRLRMIDVPTSGIKSTFAELGGKISDRDRQRRFDSAKLQSAIPGFEFRHSVESGVPGIARSLRDLPRSTGAMFEGRWNRMLALGSLSEAREDARENVPPTLVERAKYLVGRSEVAFSVARRLKEFRQGRSSDDYGTSG